MRRKHGSADHFPSRRSSWSMARMCAALTIVGNLLPIALSECSRVICVFPSAREAGVIVCVYVSTVGRSNQTSPEPKVDSGVTFNGDTDIVSVFVRSVKVRFFGFSSRQRTTRTRGELTRCRKMDFARIRSGSGVLVRAQEGQSANGRESSRPFVLTSSCLFRALVTLLSMTVKKLHKFWSDPLKVDRRDRSNDLGCGLGM